MAAVITTTPEIIIEQRVVLHDVSWAIYEGLMQTHEDRRAPRFTYNEGQLEIYMPSQKHERNAEFLADIVKTIAEERGIEALSLGLTTFRRKDAGSGVEPDGCFYLPSYDAVFRLEKIELETFPPDLVLEIDITSPSLERFPTYAGFGVPEIWRYLKDAVVIYLLREGQYVAAAESAALPHVTGALLTQWLAAGDTEKRSAWLGNLRQWARTGEKT